MSLLEAGFDSSQAPMTPDRLLHLDGATGSAVGRLHSALKRARLTDEQTTLQLERAAFTYTIHHGQKRRDGKDYVTHPYAVAESMAYDKYVDDRLTGISTALGHDVLEDTTTTRTTLFAVYGEKAGEHIITVSRGLQAEGWKRNEDEYMTGIRDAEPDVIRLKIHDKNHNLRHRPRKKELEKVLTHWTGLFARLPEEQQKDYYSQTKRAYTVGRDCLAITGEQVPPAIPQSVEEFMERYPAKTIFDARNQRRAS